MSRSVVVITAGLSSPSSTRLLADQLADATRAAVGGRGESVDVEFVELRELAVEMAQTMVSGNRPTPGLESVQAKVVAADGLIAVTPVFTASYSGLFKTFFDLLDKYALIGNPVLIAASAGTPRHSLVLEHAMRPLFAYLRAAVVPTAVFAASDDWGEAAGVQASMRTDPLQSRIRAAGRDLAEITLNRPPRARAAAPADIDLEVTPFEQLLNPGP